MTKKQLEARVAELETLVASLNAAVAAMAASRTVYVGPIPAQPTVNPTPYIPSFPMPYIGDPPYPWGPTTIGTGIVSGIGGLQGSANMGTHECRMGMTQEG
jgi:hypothetical protein